MRRIVLVALSMVFCCVPMMFLGLLDCARGAVSQSAEAIPDSIKSRPCGSDDNFPSVPRLNARQTFLSHGLDIRAASIVRTPQDMVGSIMYLRGQWLYIKDIELRYDAERLELAISRLEGDFMDGRHIQFDKSQKLPSSFRPVERLRKLEPALVRFGASVHVINSPGLRVNKDGFLLLTTGRTSSPPELRLTEAGEGEGCQMHFGGRCAGWGCFGSC